MKQFRAPRPNNAPTKYGNYFQEPVNWQGYYVSSVLTHVHAVCILSRSRLELHDYQLTRNMKMEMAVALTSVASACAFVAPSAFTGSVVSQQASTSSSSLHMAAKGAKPAKKGPVSMGGNFESALGAQPPLGFYDPAGLLKNADQER